MQQNPLLLKANRVRAVGQSLKPARLSDRSASAIVEPVGIVALLKKFCQCESGPKRLAPSDSQRSSYRARLIGSIASSSRSKSMQASLRPSASADVSPLRASRFCASIRLYATSDSRIPGSKRPQSCLSSPGVAPARRTYTGIAALRYGAAHSLQSRAATWPRRLRTAWGDRQRGDEGRADVRPTSSDKPSVVQPRALIVWIGPKSLPHKLELCAGLRFSGKKNPSSSSARTRLRPTSGWVPQMTRLHPTFGSATWCGNATRKSC